MARRKRTRATPAKTLRRGAREERALVDQAVPAEAQARGDYRVETIPGPHVVRAGRDEATTHRVVRNRGGTAVERWAAKGDLSEAQIEAITIYTRAHRMWLGEQRVTANWDAGARGSGDSEDFAARRSAARDLLLRLDKAVFMRMSLHYFETWRNVVLFDEAAGVAGSRLGYANARAEAAAKAIVQLIADAIATELRLSGPRRAK